VSSIVNELRAAGDRAAMTTRDAKKNYAERLSRALAQRFANELRSLFPGILPDESGRGQESRARTAKGFKKLDVNYSTVELGLGLGLSIKTLNFVDPRSSRYTKNFTRIDNELRAEAVDYHRRQPWAVMIAIVFLPLDSARIAPKSKSPSSFGQAVKLFRARAGRRNPKNEEELFERVFLALYESDGSAMGDVYFFDCDSAPPYCGEPTSDRLTLPELVDAIRATYDARNNPKFRWA
jgi:hypothetical protein